MPVALAAKMQTVNLASTDLRMPCAPQYAAGTHALDSDMCLPNFMQACNMISLLGRPGFICPSISLRRPMSPISAYLAQTVRGPSLDILYYWKIRKFIGSQWAEKMFQDIHLSLSYSATLVFLRFFELSYRVFSILM